MNPQQINPQRSYPVLTSQVFDNYKCWKLLTQSVNGMCSSYHHHHHHHHTHKSEERYLFRLTGTGKKAPNKRKGEKISNFQDWFDAQWPTVCVCILCMCMCAHVCVCVWCECVHVSTQVHCTQIIYFHVTLFLPTWSMQRVRSTQHSQDSCWSSLWQTVLHRQCCHQQQLVCINIQQLQCLQLLMFMLFPSKLFFPYLSALLVF